MKKKDLIYALAIVLVAAVAIVYLLTQNNKAATSVMEEPVPAVTEAAATETEAEETQAEPEPVTAAPAEEQTAERNADNKGTETHEQPFLVQITEDDPAIAYVLVRMPNPVGLLPLPQEGEYTKTLRQVMADGSESVNVLHITTNGFWMEDANCEGQDCVKQGMVTLENREERILWNMIICLPHQLSAELITREEAEAMLKP